MKLNCWHEAVPFSLSFTWALSLFCFAVRFSLYLIMSRASCLSLKECLDSELKLVKNAALEVQRFFFVFVIWGDFCLGFFWGFGVFFFVYNVFHSIVFVNQQQIQLLFLKQPSHHAASMYTVRRWMVLKMLYSPSSAFKGILVFKFCFILLVWIHVITKW